MLLNDLKNTMWNCCRMVELLSLAGCGKELEQNESDCCRRFMSLAASSSVPRNLLVPQNSTA